MLISWGSWLLHANATRFYSNFITRCFYSTLRHCAGRRLAATAPSRILWFFIVSQAQPLFFVLLFIYHLELLCVMKIYEWFLNVCVSLGWPRGQSAVSIRILKKRLQAQPRLPKIIFILKVLQLLNLNYLLVILIAQLFFFLSSSLGRISRI